jgi:hypothetical protein
MKRRRYRKLTPEVEAKILELREQEMTIDQIAVIVDLGLSTVQRCFKKHNIERKVKITPEVEERIYELKEEGYNIEQIAKDVEITAASINRFFRRRGSPKIGRAFVSGIPLETEMQIIELVEKGYGRARISQMTGIAEQYVRGYCKKSNIDVSHNTTKTKITPEVGQKILELITKGLNYTQLGMLFDITKTTIRKFCLANGIKSIKLNPEQKKARRQFRKRFSKSVHRALKEHGSLDKYLSIADYLLYTIEELMMHIEELFSAPYNLAPDGSVWMTWNNWGVYSPKLWDDNDPSTWRWHLDHITPDSEFHYTSMTDQAFRDCWALSNLRPYSAKQNVIEGARKIRHQKTASEQLFDQLMKEKRDLKMNPNN